MKLAHHVAMLSGQASVNEEKDRMPKLLIDFSSLCVTKVVPHLQGVLGSELILRQSAHRSR